MISYAAISRPGGREVNEDSLDFYERQGTYFFALADGLGGHGQGEVASKIVVTEAIAAFKTGGGDLARCFTYAQERLLAEQARQNVRDELKSTLVCLKIVNDKAVWGHVGDSRLYCFAKNGLAARSLDHSVPQMLVASGEIREKDIRGHEDRNRLLRVMGMEWNSPKYEIGKERALGKRDAFLLCSDGFWEWITEKDMIRHLRGAAAPAAWLAAMEADILANAKGHNMDNYSAIAVFVS
ncbi:MAG: protein phosphatase 2C domain-containing protein [Peptococcaceae bacterium]|jgi:serine/threonine protein phosphatase PrpC|nr:protein phosphatase 2C domain-containing protein [Peptococcaceae bacterium]